MTIILTVIFYLWLFLLLVLLWLIWRNSVRTREAQQVLHIVAMKNAESAQKTAEAVYILAKSMEK